MSRRQRRARRAEYMRVWHLVSIRYTFNPFKIEIHEQR